MCCGCKQQSEFLLSISASSKTRHKAGALRIRHPRISLYSSVCVYYAKAGWAWRPGVGRNCNSSHSEAGCGTNDARQEHTCAGCWAASEALGIRPAQRPHSRPLLDYSPTTSSHHRKRHAIERVLSSTRSSNWPGEMWSFPSIHPSISHLSAHPSVLLLSLNNNKKGIFCLICSKHC